MNKAFVDLNGFSHEECIGKPALSVLQLENWGSTWVSHVTLHGGRVSPLSLSSLGSSKTMEQPAYWTGRR